ncbi:unnamed protein product [Paramecium primaurelia]|uniref:Uncharacterized protein n=1 Tax=Paramecium primaurelia TaxID=5886 RepID=A0A8S1NHT8_PARPR|nr:unnamed protein product [Paramecium primaurelia]
MKPNITMQVFYLLKIKMQSEQYKIATIFGGNILISQVLLESIIIVGRIIIYRFIATSLKNMDLNPLYYFMHFFVMHSSLEEIFEDYVRI